MGVGDRPWGRNKIPIAPSAAGIAEPFCRTAGLSVPRRSNDAWFEVIEHRSATQGDFPRTWK
ncbi:MAG: hypothetical protein ACK58T_48930, partial [Phycisphaerae bacterium]